MTAFVIASVAVSTAEAQVQTKRQKNPVEIGTVRWSRDLDASLAASRASGKPVFLLFQEVPGCAGCQKFGREVLSHPLIVEAIEDEFHPVVVFNNRSSGPDKKLLEQFGERAWNYQVVRFLDADGNDIVKRKEGIWSLAGVAARMAETLEARDRSIPRYLQTLVSLGKTASHEQVAFAMHCFWTGEYRLGGIEGVIATEAGWLDGREVTLVRYDTSQLDLETLAQRAAKVRCADKIYTADGRSLAGLRAGKLDKRYRTASAADQKRQIARWQTLAKVPGINAMQLTKLNAMAPDDMGSALEWLSPRQRALVSK
ncbi:MAG: VPGUxxT family thioredoxin-like (seleno)protein, type 2 [Planctomycetota bacterium]